MPESKQKSVLITGCSLGGIGSSLVSEFQRRGLHVFATARNLVKMDHLAELPNVTLLALDVTDHATIRVAAAKVHAATGGTLDYLVNNAASQHIAPVIDSELDTARSIFEVNFFGVLLMCQAFAPLLIPASGCIVNICSISGHLHTPWMGIYQASKAATEMLSETMRLELQPLGVTVLSLVTGAVESNIMTGSTTIKLPETSPYKVKSVEDAMAKLTSPDDGIKRTPTKEHAAKVVGDILGGASGKIWRGQMAGMTNLASKFMPASVRVNDLRLVHHGYVFSNVLILQDKTLSANAGFGDLVKRAIE